MQRTKDGIQSIIVNVVMTGLQLGATTMYWDYPRVSGSGDDPAALLLYKCARRLEQSELAIQNDAELCKRLHHSSNAGLR